MGTTQKICWCWTVTSPNKLVSWILSCAPQLPQKNQIGSCHAWAVVTTTYLPEGTEEDHEQEDGDHQGEHCHKLVSQSPVQATRGLEVPDPQHTTLHCSGSQCRASIDFTNLFLFLFFFLLLLLLHSSRTHLVQMLSKTKPCIIFQAVVSHSS